jgi:hypothetical protein
MTLIDITHLILMLLSIAVIMLIMVVVTVFMESKFWWVLIRMIINPKQMKLSTDESRKRYHYDHMFTFKQYAVIFEYEEVPYKIRFIQENGQFDSLYIGYGKINIKKIFYHMLCDRILERHRLHTDVHYRRNKVIEGLKDL